MNTSNVRLVDPPPTDPLKLLTGHFRDAIALRCSKADVRFPAVCDLEAKVLAAIHTELRGVASALAGTHTAENWRERLRGERIFPLHDLCRLAMSPTREGRAAAIAALVILARAAGHLLVPVKGDSGTVVETAVRAASVATDALREVTLAIANGKICPADVEALWGSATELRHATAWFETSAIRSKERTRYSLDRTGR